MLNQLIAATSILIATTSSGFAQDRMDKYEWSPETVIDTYEVRSWGTVAGVIISFPDGDQATVHSCNRDQSNPGTFILLKNNDYFEEKHEALLDSFNYGIKIRIAVDGCERAVDSRPAIVGVMRTQPLSRKMKNVRRNR